ncbi:MAG: NAD(P)-dependent oxidoreductase [Isosphaeraceae bacterium]
MPTVLIGPLPLRGQPGPFRALLRDAGFDTFIEPDGGGTLTEQQLREALPHADAMLAGGERLTAELLDLAPRLRAIARTGVGYDAIDIDAATARRIPVTITPGTNQESVAEQTFGLLLALTRNVVHNDQVIRAGGYDRSLVRPLRGATMGLVGLGRIGRAVASRALAFEMKVVAFDPLSDPDFDARYGITRVGFEELLATADVVSLHLPLSPATQNLINRHTLAADAPRCGCSSTPRAAVWYTRPTWPRAFARGSSRGPDWT